MIYIATDKNKIVYVVDTSEGEQGILNSLAYEGITEFDKVQAVSDPYFQGVVGADLRQFNLETWQPKTETEILTEFGKSKLEDNEVILFDDGWEVIESYLNKTVFNKENYLQQDICTEHQIPEGWTKLEPIKDRPNKWEVDKWIVDKEKYREQKAQEITWAFDTELSEGKFLSQALGIEVDCRRSSNKNDKQNVEGLINHMVRNSITEITYVGYDSVKENVTKVMLENLVGEMEDCALGLYNRKWQLETAVKQAKTVGELENIKW